jgi:hypothetical protein
MKYLFWLLLLVSNEVFSQESKIRMVKEVIIADSLVLETYEIMIFNNTGHKICLSTSITFGLHILSKDTIELAPLSYDLCKYFSLNVSKEDSRRNYNSLPSYPIILSSRTCFMTTINVIRDTRCKSTYIKYSYINQAEFDYDKLFKSYEDGHSWDNDPKLKFRESKIYLRALNN